MESEVSSARGAALSPARTRLLIGLLITCAAIWGIRLQKPDLLPWWSWQLPSFSFSSHKSGTAVSFATLSGFNYHFLSRPNVTKDFTGKLSGLTDTVPPEVRALSGKQISNVVPSPGLLWTKMCPLK